MAACLPTTNEATSGWINRTWDIVPMDTSGLTPNNAPVMSSHRISALRQLTFYFADADDTETFKQPPGTLAVAWQAAGTGDTMSAIVGATNVQFSGTNNSNGWLHCLCRGNLALGTATTEAPVGKGTAGFVDPDMGMFLNHKHATPDTLASGRPIANKHGLRLQIWPFTGFNSGDVWAVTSSGLLPGVVAVAWMVEDTSEAIAATLNASGDVVLTGTPPSDTGWLWTWRRR